MFGFGHQFVFCTEFNSPEDVDTMLRNYEQTFTDPDLNTFLRDNIPNHFHHEEPPLPPLALPLSPLSPTSRLSTPPLSNFTPDLNTFLGDDVPNHFYHEGPLSPPSPPSPSSTPPLSNFTPLTIPLSPATSDTSNDEAKNNRPTLSEIPTNQDHLYHMLPMSPPFSPESTMQPDPIQIEPIGGNLVMSGKMLHFGMYLYHKYILKT